MLKHTNHQWTKQKESREQIYSEKELQTLKEAKRVKAEAKRQKDLAEFNSDLAKEFNKFSLDKITNETTKKYYNQQDKTLVEYIEKKLKDLEDFQEFKTILQGLFQVSPKQLSEYTEGIIIQINEEQQKLLDLRKDGLKLEFDIFEEIITNLFKISEEKVYEELLKKIAAWLEIDYEQLKSRIYKRFDLDRDKEEPKIARIEDIDDNSPIEASANERKKAKNSLLEEFNKLLDELNKDHFRPQQTNGALSGENRSSVSSSRNVVDLQEGAKKNQGEYGKSYEDKSTRLKDNFKSVVKEYYETYYGYTKEQIREYGERIRHSEKVNEIDIVPAVMRANEIAKSTKEHKYSLRAAQILAILEFLDESNNKFCQINTGEGKTTITSALAVIKALQGQKVDIITSNEVLAKDAIEERKSFYTLFGISVNHNIPDPSELNNEGFKACYGYDVVYGTIGTFAYDHLHNNVEAYETKVISIKDRMPEVRGYDVVIIDEADNIILDNYALVTNQAKPISGLDQVKFIYFEIWRRVLQESNRLGIKNINDAEREELKLKIDLKQLEEEVRKEDRLPSFLKIVIINKLELLIENAIKAKYEFHLEEDYIIGKLGKDSQDNILPLEKELGVRLQNFIWTDIHPFIQMKHNMHVNSGSVASTRVARERLVKVRF